MGHQKIHIFYTDFKNVHLTLAKSAPKNFFTKTIFGCTFY
jgi:hypothetical protein